MSNQTRFPPGKCGMANLDNTCYMGSAIQCLSNMPPLRDFFLSDAFFEDINEENPMGSHGVLATTIAEFFKMMWSGENESIVPRRLKAVIAVVAPMFSGSGQHDAHEFLAYVLDGLHEDLNRIRVMPQLENSEEMYSLPDAEHAAMAWERYKARNDSIIIDILHGQLKSTLTCPACSTVSTKFEPFAYLSLPLPQDENVTQQHIILMFKEKKWMRIVLDVTEFMTVATAQKQILRMLKLDGPVHFIAFCVLVDEEDEIQLFRPTDSVRVRGSNVYFCEVEHDPTAPNARFFVTYNRDRQMCMCSLPMIYTVAPGVNLTRSLLTSHVLDATSRMFMTPIGVQEVEAVQDDHEMFGAIAVANRAPYKLYVLKDDVPIALLPTYDLIRFPKDDIPGEHDPFTNYVGVVFQWKSMNYFNEHSEDDMIHREISISREDTVDLLEAVDSFVEREQLGESDLWKCPNCEQFERAFKQLALWKLPEILILHLKRFQFTEVSSQKLKWEVKSPVFDLDLTSKMANPNHERAVYDLIGISKHFGTLDSGHYTAAAYNDKVQKWVDFNDSKTTFMADPIPIYTSHDPYMLIYRRKSATQNVATQREIILPETTLPEADQPESAQPEAPQKETTLTEAAQPKSTLPEATQPEIVQPKAVEPEGVEPEAVEPEAVEPEAVQPDATQKETTQKETTLPEASQDVTTLPEATLPEAAQKEPTQKETTQKETTQNVTTLPETTLPEATEPEVVHPDATQKETFQNVTTLPEATLPEVTLPEASQNVTTLPEAAQSDAIQKETTLPEATQPEATQKETTLPETVHPEAAQPEAAQPDAAQPDATQPDATQKETTQTAEEPEQE